MILVYSSKTSVTIEMIKEAGIYQDGYTNQDSYDNCLIEQMVEQQHNDKIKKFLKANEQGLVTDGLEKEIFEKQSEILESGRGTQYCKRPSLTAQFSFTLENVEGLKGNVLGIDYRSFVPLGYQSFLKETFFFELEFSDFSTVKEVIKKSQLF